MENFKGILCLYHNEGCPPGELVRAIKDIQETTDEFIKIRTKEGLQTCLPLESFGNWNWEAMSGKKQRRHIHLPQRFQIRVNIGKNGALIFSHLMMKQHIFDPQSSFVEMQDFVEGIKQPPATRNQEQQSQILNINNPDPAVMKNLFKLPTESNVWQICHPDFE